MFTGLLQPTHLIILLAVALIFLGPKRLPDAARALGQGLREFKASVSHEELPEAADSTHEETHPVQHGDTAPVRHETTPTVQ
jgi:sec-independent protein translocase protein TatA